jgi:hypothetical protein
METYQGTKYGTGHIALAAAQATVPRTVDAPKNGT